MNTENQNGGGIRKRLLPAVIAGGLVAGLAAVPAVSASAYDGTIEERCTDLVKAQSRGNWQHGEFKLCVSKKESTIYFTVHIENLEAYLTTPFVRVGWESNDEGQWTTQASTTVELVCDGVKRQPLQVTSTFNRATGTITGTFPAPAPGDYTVVANGITVNGPYWMSHTWDIEAGTLSQELVVG